MKKKIIAMLAAMMCLASSSLSYSSVAIAANSLNSNDIAEVKITSSNLKECNLVTESKNDGCWINFDLVSGAFAMSGNNHQSFSIIGSFERKDNDLYLYPENGSAEFYILHREEDHFVSQSDEIGVQLKACLVFYADNDAFGEILLDWTPPEKESNNTGDTVNQEYTKGDVNNDGSFNVSDVVLLQKWLLAVPDTHLANWKAVDFCEDNKLNVFDLCLMKRALIEEVNKATTTETPLITIETYEKYKDFLTQNKLPEEFVEFDDVREIGSFNSLVFTSDAMHGDYSEYSYGFIDAGGNKVYLTVAPVPKSTIAATNLSLSVDDIDKTDMRFTNSKDCTGIFKEDKLNYKYVNGTLTSISWEQNGLNYTVSCNSTFSDYIVNTNSFVSKLLVYETATETIDQFDSHETIDISVPFEIPLITIASYNEYKDFLTLNKLPEDFVEFDDVKEIGSFSSLVFTSDAMHGDYSEYSYGFIDAGENKVYLTVAPVSKSTIAATSLILSVDDIDKTDMRFTNSKECTGIFKNDKLNYKYVNGVLLSISWGKDNLRYVLSCDSTFSDYKLSNNSFVSKLLNYN